jgi:hypothetical protein
MKQVKENKLTTPYNSTPMKVLKKDGNSVVVQSPLGKEVRRNSTYFKLYHDKETENDKESEVNSDRECSEKACLKTPNVTTKIISESEPEDRVKRQTKIPNYLNDYIID